MIQPFGWHSLFIVGGISDRTNPRSTGILWFVLSGIFLALMAIGRLGAIPGPVISGLLISLGMAHPWGFFAYAAVGFLGALLFAGTRPLRVSSDRVEIAPPTPVT